MKIIQLLNELNINEDIIYDNDQELITKYVSFKKHPMFTANVLSDFHFS